jgi:hypothetical protein
VHNEARILGGKQVRHRTLNLSLSLSLLSAVRRLRATLLDNLNKACICRLANQRPEGKVRGWYCMKPEG